MKARRKYKALLYSILTFCLLGQSACITKHLHENEVLVRHVKFKNFDAKLKPQMMDLVATGLRPNNSLDLRIYYLFNKQGKRNWNTTPSLLDSSLVELSRLQIERYLQGKGSLDATVSASINVKKKKATLTFEANQGHSYIINEFKKDINDSIIRGLYYAESPLIRNGAIYDVETLSDERERIAQQMIANGYYYFDKQNVTFEVDSFRKSHSLNLLMKIKPSENTRSHKRHRFGNTYFNIQGDYDAVDTIAYKEQYFFTDHSKKLSPRNFFYYLYYQKGDWYFPPREKVVLSRLTDLGIFKNVDLSIKPNPKDSLMLDMFFKLSLRKRMSNNISGDFNFNDATYGFNIGNVFSNNNVFGGGEQLNISLKAGLRTNIGSTSLDSKLQNQNYQIKVDFTLPKLLSPFKLSNRIGLYGIPKTTFSSIYQKYEQVNAIQRDAIINSFSYTWMQSNNKLFKITPFNIEYVNGKLARGFYNELISRGEYAYLYIVNRTILTLGSQYQFSYNARKINHNENFVFFQANLDVAGHTLQLYDFLFGMPKTNDGYKKIFDIPFSQYIRPEIDVRKYWRLSSEEQFVARINMGVGYPLGNSNALTYEKFFFSGGFNSMRAWSARTIGPGNYIRTAGLVNDLTANLGHFGEIKGEMNFEYRFKIAQLGGDTKLKGALFTDLGNIWRLKKETETPNGEINWNRLDKQIAIGVGTGLRLDLGFFVFRFDIGLKVKDPAFGDGDQWVIKHLQITQSQFQKDFYNTYGWTYNLVQYNLGIGMPF